MSEGKMPEAPARIWLNPRDPYSWSEEGFKGETGYVRADLLAEAVELLEEYEYEFSCECGREDNGDLCRKVCGVCDLERKRRAFVQKIKGTEGKAR